MAERLRLYYPVKPHHVNQPFAGNLPCVKNFGLPNQVVITGADNNTCPASFEKMYPKFGMTAHNGLDLMAGVQNIYAACAGTVVEKQDVPARGLGVGVLTDIQYDLGVSGVHYIKIRYWHLKSFYCDVGQKIESGQLIGVSNNTGYSSGNHLHFEGQPMDKDAGGHPVLALPNNGIGAAIDLEPFFTGIFAQDVPSEISRLQKLLVELRQRLANLIAGR